MRRPFRQGLRLLVGCCLLLTLALSHQASGQDAPRLRSESQMPGVRSPADEVRDVMRGGQVPQPQADSAPGPPSFDPKDITFPAPEIEFPKPVDHSGKISAISSIAVPAAILLVFAVIAVRRRRS